MKPEEFNTLLKADLYQVFLFVCPAALPVSFARHSWFVIQYANTIQRYEVLWRRNQGGESRGHLHINCYLPAVGIPKIPFLKNSFHWKGACIDYIEGGEGSIAKRMHEYIKNSYDAYPYTQYYSILGPNSNTYVQSILDKFPESGFVLPQNAFGKDFIVQ